ncbi:MAG: L-aspartate oxidase [Negativicutes bacterium]
MSQRSCFDCLVIGSGIAGLCTAIKAAENGMKVAVLSKETELNICNTNHAQGGIVATNPIETAAALEKDILRAGDYANYLDAVHYLSEQGAPLIEPFLADKMGVPFCKNAAGEYDRTREGAHSERRILHVKDGSGEAIETALIAYVDKLKNITVYTEYTVIDLITNTHQSRDPQERYNAKRVIGAYVLNGKTNDVEIIFAPRTVLATGGVGGLYTYTSNITGATGDGLAIAERLGAEIINAEYIQFHPTVLFHRDLKRFLITEALRGEGARLCNRRGEYFMDRYSPELKDLAPRDEVARAIYCEMENDDAGYVFLDARNITHVDVADRFPKVFNNCLKVGIDIRKDLIPVVPAAHYFCGGIKVDGVGRTSIDGLWAVGEVSCTGVHGANRLASVSLLEGVVWGINAGCDIAQSKHSIAAELCDSIPDWILPKIEETIDPVLINQDISMVRKIMWNYCGIIRNRKRMTRALADLNYLHHRVEQFYRSARITRQLIELHNAVTASWVIIRSALSNSESKGCHFVEQEHDRK